MLVNEMVTFYYVVNLKSFSKAALKLKVSKSYVSKHITLLEQNLKVKLLNRSTRSITLTEEGALFYQHCQAVFERIQMGYDEIINIRTQLSGTLKISVPPAFALHVLDKLLAKFSIDNPQVKLDINLDNRIEDIIGQGYDLAIRSAVLQSSNLIAQQIGVIDSLLCASPDYLEKYGPLNCPDDMVNHRVGVYSNGKSTYEIKFLNGKRIFNVAVNPYLQSNSLDFILHIVKSGCCMAIFPDFMVKPEIASGNLLKFLPGYEIPSSPFYAIYPDKKFIPLRVKVFIELLKMSLAELLK